jgi:molybdenum cofactor cytidylyltransferase
MGDVWAIVLAAGESTRMKVPKMLLPFRGKTIIENVLENVVSSQVDKTLVVLGSDKDEILKLVGRWPVKHCYNEVYKEGMLSSVKCGFRSLQGKFDASIVFLGDQPMIGPEIINMVISAFRASGKGIVVPAFRNKRGHPLLISSKYNEEIESLDPVKGLRELVRKFSADVFEVDTGTHSILRDIDTREDYLYELKQIK